MFQKEFLLYSDGEEDYNVKLWQAEGSVSLQIKAGNQKISEKLGANLDRKQTEDFNHLDEI